MSNNRKINRCLISVSDKTGLKDLAEFLVAQGVEIISTGGTFKFLSDNKIPVIAIDDVTCFPEIMDGRVKTLHPKIHGGLLGIVDNKEHQEQAAKNGIKPIDLVIVNFYPFKNTVLSGKSDEEIIENIDIGGPSMVRSAAKNFHDKVVIVDQSFYRDLTTELKNNNGSTTLEFRKKCVVKAFEYVAEYDNDISDWFTKSSRTIKLSLKQNLRYGENPHQNASVYTADGIEGGVVNALQIQGKELSYNNICDTDAAYTAALDFSDPICVIVKHGSPCAIASSSKITDAYKKAFSCDSKSAFGGIVALNREIDEELAVEISQVFYEVIIASSVSDKAKEIFSKKKNLRVLTADFKRGNEKIVKSVSGGFLIQDHDLKVITENDLECVSEKSVSADELKQLAFAMNSCKHAKSNAVVIAENFEVIGIGSGQTNRSDACLIACKKAEENKKTRGISGNSYSYMASDAFFPFVDNVEIASEFGVHAIVTPCGSIRDNEVIAKANEKKIALYFIKTRHFKH